MNDEFYLRAIPKINKLIHSDHFRILEPCTKSKEDRLRLDLTGLGMVRTDEDLFKDHYKMLTIGQLQVAEDSLLRSLDMRMSEQQAHLRNSLYILRDKKLHKQDTPPVLSKSELLLEPAEKALEPELDLQARNAVYDVATNMVRNNVNYIQRSLDERKGRIEQVNRFRIEWHRKLMLAFACLVFFFIGAPLGAIIRKGGMGLPTVFAIMFFLVFHIISFSMEKLAIAGGITPWPGMWISTLVLLPVGVLLTWKAATDSPLFDADSYYRGWQRILSLFKRSDANSSAL